MPLLSLHWDVLNLIVKTSYWEDGIKPLKNLSMVSKALCPLSQSFIFREFDIDFKKMKQILSSISPEATDATDKTENITRDKALTVLSYVQDLIIDARDVSLLVDRCEEFLELLLFFTNVTHLQVSSWKFHEFRSGQVSHFFSHFGRTVRTLKLLDCYLNSEVTIFLTSLFPLIDDLWVLPQHGSRRKTFIIQHVDRPPNGVKFQGNLIFMSLKPQHEKFLAFVNECSSKVQSISAQCCQSDGELQKLFDAQGCKLTSVCAGWTNKIDTLSFSSCSQLRVISIDLLGKFEWNDPNWGVLNTLTSPYLEEIRIRDFNYVMEGSRAEWEETDGLLCQCSDRIYPTKLCVTLQPNGVTSKQVVDCLMTYVKSVWPRFLRKGAISLDPRPMRGEQ